LKSAAANLFPRVNREFLRAGQMVIFNKGRVIRATGMLKHQYRRNCIETAGSVDEAIMEHSFRS
jgi:hypothetical protein